MMGSAPRKKVTLEPSVGNVRVEEGSHIETLWDNELKVGALALRNLI